MDKFDVKFHFPYATVSTTVSEDKVGHFNTYMRTKTVFHVQEGKVEYTINPDLVTYMEVRPSLPF